MALWDALQTGTLGIKIAFAPRVEPTRNEEAVVELRVAEIQAAWWMFYFGNLHLDLSDAGWPTLQRDVACQARALFEQATARNH
jgi:hypothetical protein